MSDLTIHNNTFITTDPTLALANLSITYTGTDVWIEGKSQPLSEDTFRVVGCCFHAASAQRALIAYGTREQLEDSRALIKVVTQPAPASQVDANT